MAPTPPTATQRLDRWLWCARFVRSRALAARLCTSDQVALGGVLVQKAHQAVRVGDQLDVWTSGGGGYGDPLQRPPAMVLEDVLDGKVSAGAARTDYGVVIRDHGVDGAATATLRAELAERRGPVTWRYDRGPLGRE